jgi:hypothetical protein
MATIREEIHTQISRALAAAIFPIDTPEALLAAFPAGAGTTCQVGNVKMTAGEAGQLLKPTDFPFRNARQVADIIVERAGL